MGRRWDTTELLSRQVLNDSDSDGDDVIEIPRDYPVIRTTAPELAVKWRAQVGAQFAELIASGGAVVGFGNHGYVVRRGTGS